MFGSDRASDTRCQHIRNVDAGAAEGTEGGVWGWSGGRIGFPVELRRGRRCHRGVATWNIEFLGRSTGVDGREGVACV